MSTDSQPIPRSYPRTVDGQVQIDRMRAEHAPAMLAFAQSLPEHDLLFLPRDISQPKVIDAWIRQLDNGSAHSLVALAAGKIVGCTAMFRDPLSWSPHVGELRVLVSADMRGKGLGRAMVQEIFATALELGLEKLVVQMTVDQRGAIAVFEEMGFRAEALLRDHVKDRAGIKHDIAVLSHDVAGEQARMQNLGLA